MRKIKLLTKQRIKEIKEWLKLGVDITSKEFKEGIESVDNV